MNVSQIALAIAAVALSASASAATTTYTSPAAFAAALAPGAYVEGFGDPSFSGDPSASFVSGTIGYTVSAPSGLYGNGAFIGTNLPDEALTVTFTGTPVTAVGGLFYSTNISDVFQAVPVTLTLSDGTTTTFTPTSTANSFAGFTSTIAITSLTMGAPGAAFYAGIDSLTVGTAVAAVPEPGTWLMMALGAGALVLRQQRRQKQA